MAVSTNPPPRGSCGLTPTHPIAPKLGGSPHRPPHSASPWPHSGVQPHWGAQGEHPHGDTAVPKCHQAGAPVTHREGTASHGWHRGRDGTPSSPRPVPNPVVPLPTPPPTPRAPSSLCPRLGVPLGIQAPVQLWVGGVWVIVLIQKVQGVVAGQPPDGEFVGHFGPLLPVAGDALVQLRGFGEEVLQQPGGAKGGLMAPWSPQPQRWISIGGAATQHGAMGCRGGDENAAL